MASWKRFFNSPEIEVYCVDKEGFKVFMENGGKEIIGDAMSKDMKFDKGKTRMSLLLAGIAPSVKAVADILTFGAEKYEAHSWKTVPNAEERYLDALYRHLNAIHSGENVDPESGRLHWAHVACNAMFLLWFALQK